MSSVSSSRPSSATSSSVAGFGTNEWLVEEMYQQYLADPGSVDQAWHEFFADYRPGSPVGGGDRKEPSPNGAAAAAPKPAAAAPKPAAAA
ncbi:MAG: kgd, partial [Blastococcus sp.]|nr:kgd [Blastococcus sp.]